MTRGFRIAFKAAIILIAIIAAVLIASMILWLIGAKVGATFYTICIAPLTNMLHISEVMIRAIPLCIIAIGISVAYRSGIINIGAEGQMAMGILAFTGVALAFPDVPRPLLLPLALLEEEVFGAIFLAYCGQSSMSLSSFQPLCSTTSRPSSIPSASALSILIRRRRYTGQEPRSR